MDSIFLDTNSLRNHKANHFFGNIKEYARISQVANIVIPSIVIDEIKRQKERFLQSQLSKFRSNYFTYYLDCETGDTLFSHIHEQVESLYEQSQSEFPYSEEHLNHDGILKQIKYMAIQNHAPFELDNDKGFKDSYIYFTVTQYLERSGGNIFIVSNDNRFREAFSDKKHITVLSTVDQYYDYRKAYFKEEYFLGRLQDHLGTDSISADDVKLVDLTDNDEWKIELEIDSEPYTIYADFYSREILEE